MDNLVFLILALAIGMWIGIPLGIDKAVDEIELQAISDASIDFDKETRIITCEPRREIDDDS